MAIRRRGVQADRISQYIVVWCGDQAEQVSFDGTVFWLPARDEEANHKDGLSLLEPATDRSGLPIAGTVIVKDKITYKDGVRVKLFDADLFVNWMNVYRQDLFDRGLAIVDLPEEVEQAKTEGIPLWVKSEDKRARAIVEREFSRRLRYEQKGLAAPISSSEHHVLWAIKHLSEREVAVSAVSTDQLRAALSGIPLAQATAPKAPTLPSSSAPRPLAANSSGAEIYARAKKLGITPVKADLEGLLEDDPESCTNVRKQIAEKESRLAKQLEEAGQQVETAAS
jgi:hypothetical protein